MQSAQLPHEVGLPYRWTWTLDGGDALDCVWLAGELDDDGDPRGGCVAIRVAYTGDDAIDWMESDAAADTLADAEALARTLHDEHLDAGEDRT